MINDISLLDNNFIVIVVCLVLKLETLRIPYMNTSLFDIRLISLKILDPTQLVIMSGNKIYEGNLSVDRGLSTLGVIREMSHVFLLKQIPS